MFFYETGDGGAFCHDPAALCVRHLKEISNTDFRDQYQPWDQRVFVQEHVAVFQSAHKMAVGEQLLMYLELRQGYSVLFLILCGAAGYELLK